MTFSPLTTQTSGNGGQYSSRNGAMIDRIILHHCASTSLAGVLGMMSSGSREVSANYVVGNDGEIVGVVPEEYRAWTSGSASWDGRAITFEIVNETAGPEWRISEKAFDAVARMLADVSLRYGISLSRETVVTHQELYSRYGASYATACPGPFLQSRIDQLLTAADDVSKPTPAPAPEPTIGDLMAFKSIGIAYRPDEKVRDRLLGTALDFEDGQKTTEYAMSKEYTESLFGKLTDGGAVILSGKAHYDRLLADFDAAMQQKRAHELAVAAASQGK